jgi:hypothetical protein
MSDQPNETELMSGGLEQTPIASDTPTPEPTTELTQEPVAGAVPSEQGVYLGGKRFDSQAHLEAYISQLEQQATQRATSATVQAPQTQVEDFDFATEFYSDPNAAAKKLAERTRLQVLKEVQTQQAQANAVNDFYRKNPDLEKSREIVEFMYGKYKTQLESQPLDRAMEMLAKESRSFLAKARGVPTGNGSEMPKGSVVSTGASGNVAPKPVQQEAPKVLSFADQVKQMQRRVRK